ncbi:MAG TPA: FkbM family methyltransferase [Phycisphaerae bacterium]|nr:FkbM family methyltransferase [Phycisphaerae bacterium]
MKERAQIAKHDKLIYDVGMHRGEDTEFYLTKGFRVIGFEADPKLAEHCRGRLAAEIESGRLVVVEGAIVPDSGAGSVTFYRNIDSSVWGTTDPQLAERNRRLAARSDQIEVAPVDFAECLRRFGMPHYMKIDIEGQDLVCLRRLADFDARPAYVSIESHKLTMAGLRAEIELLEQLGYDRFQAVQQATVPRHRPPSPPGEGAFVEHRFAMGASGLFGRELPGPWRTADQILRRYRTIMTWYRILGDESLLRKCAAGRRLLALVDRIAGRPVPGWYDTHARHASVAGQ